MTAAAMLKVANEWGLEGIVAKRRDSPYRTGHRSSDWVKIKIVSRDEFVIGGWEPRENEPHRTGALLLGYYNRREPGLLFAGRVGTGFAGEIDRIIIPLLQGRERKTNPFMVNPGKNNTRYVKPVLVASINYRRWPVGGLIQQASFQGIRDDVHPGDVVIERTG